MISYPRSNLYELFFRQVVLCQTALDPCRLLHYCRPIFDLKDSVMVDWFVVSNRREPPLTPCAIITRLDPHSRAKRNYHDEHTHGDGALQKYQFRSLAKFAHTSHFSRRLACTRRRGPHSIHSFADMQSGTVQVWPPLCHDKVCSDRLILVISIHAAELR